VLAIENKVGVIELVMNPKDPAILYAAAYDKERTAWRLRQGGPGSGIYKTTDAGDNWTRLEGGLPTGNIGRIGLDVFPANPDVLYAVVENLSGTTPTFRSARSTRSPWTWTIRITCTRAFRTTNRGARRSTASPAAWASSTG
jgi:hypothetical protein